MNVGWPAKTNYIESIKCFWDVKNELLNVDGVLVRETKWVAPTSIREDLVNKAHTEHQGFMKTKE